MDTSSCSVAETFTTQAMCTNTPRSARSSKTLGTPTPSKTRTPRSCSRTPTEGDRFIPAREDDLDIAHFYMTQKNETTGTSNYVSALEETIFEGRSSKILSFKAKAPTPQIHVQNLHAPYPSLSKTISPRKHRHIPLEPVRVLDAPGYADDFYLNVLDWGKNNILAVGLGNAVYLWNASNSNISMLPCPDEQQAVTSLHWLTGTNYIAIGTDNNTVQIWDVEKEKKVREMGGHSGRVGTLAWSNHMYTLSSGSRDTTIVNHDVRVQNHHTATLTHHTQEVCGLQWNCGGSLLASGSNDNMANIWDVRYSRLQRGSTFSPLYTLPHMGAVKALAWCPFQTNLLATGGGSSDRCIRFFSSSTGGLLNTIDTSTQVCQLLWSTHYRELVSAHGFSDYNLTVWKYPSMQKAARLFGHCSRVLSLALSPDGETCVSGAADETLRFWHIFERDSKSSSSYSKQPLSAINNRNTMIR